MEHVRSMIDTYYLNFSTAISKLHIFIENFFIIRFNLKKFQDFPIYLINNRYFLLKLLRFRAINRCHIFISIRFFFFSSTLKDDKDSWNSWKSMEIYPFLENCLINDRTFYLKLSPSRSFDFISFSNRVNEHLSTVKHLIPISIVKYFESKYNLKYSFSRST